MSGQGKVTLELTALQLLAISNALNEVCHGPEAIPESEFQTRMGVERAEAKQTLERIVAAIDRDR